MHAAVTTTLQRHKRYTLRRPVSFLRSRSRGEIQELKTRWRERRERARERERAGEERERESGGFRRGGIAPQENDGTEVAVCLPCGAACSRWARERAAGGPAQESAGQGSCKRARGRRRLAGLRSASAIAGFSHFEMEKMNACTHRSPFLLSRHINEQERRVRAGAGTLRHSTTGAAGGRRRWIAPTPPFRRRL